MKWLRIVGIAVAVLVVAALALPFFINANQFRPILEERLTAALGREVKIGDLKLSLFSGGASASDVTIADDPAFSKEPFLRAKDFAVGVELWPLIFSHQLNVTSLTIDQPEIGLIQSRGGRLEFFEPGRQGRIHSHGCLSREHNFFRRSPNRPFREAGQDLQGPAHPE